MRPSESYVKNRAVVIINSCTKPRQTLIAQAYLHLLISKTGCSLTEFGLIYKVRDMIEVKISQLCGNMGQEK